MAAAPDSTPDSTSLAVTDVSFWGCSRAISQLFAATMTVMFTANVIHQDPGFVSSMETDTFMKICEDCYSLK